MTREPAFASAVLAVALVSVGHAAIFIRLADADPLVVAAFRLGIATAVLAPVAVWRGWRELARLTGRQVALTGAASLLLAAHFATWIASLDHTSIANSVTLVVLTPLWLALFAYIVGGHRPHRLMWGAIALALAGSAVMGAGSARLGLATLGGDALALAGGFFFAAYLMVAQAARRDVGLFTYVVLSYGGAAVVLWAVVLALGLPVRGLSAQTYQAMIAIALVSQMIGHTGFNWALRVLSPAFIAVLLLGEPVLSTLLGWLYFTEGFGPETAVGAVLILVGIWLGVRAEAAVRGAR